MTNQQQPPSPPTVDIEMASVGTTPLDDPDDDELKDELDADESEDEPVDDESEDELDDFVFPTNIDDGLPDVNPKEIPKKYRWPFNKCGDYTFQRDDDMYKWNPEERMFNIDKSDSIRGTTKVSKAYYKARKALIAFKEKYGQSTSLKTWKKGKKVLALWKKVLKAEVDVSDDERKKAADYMFRAMALYRMSLFIENYNPILPNWYQTAWLDKQGALVYRNPASMILYAECLVYGYGGVKKNITQGIRLLWYAGSQGFPRAYLNLGEIFEKGLDGANDGRNPDKLDAINCFKQATTVCEMYKPLLNDDSRPWKGMVGTDEDLRDEMKEDLPIWHETADIVGTALGSRFNWVIGSQAFLFIAASGLVNVDSSNKENRYLPLLFMLPCLGMVLALFAIVFAFESIIRNGLRRREVYELVDAKLCAYEAMAANKLGVADADTKKFARLRFCNFAAQSIFLVLAILFFVSWALLLSTVIYKELDKVDSLASRYW